MRRVTLSTMLCFALAAAAAAQNADQPGDTPEALLGGPPVEVEAEAPSLVERDYEGKLRPLEVRAEVAAIGLLGLTEAEREAVDELVAERAALVDSVVFDNLELLTQLRSAASNAEPREPGERRQRRDGSNEALFTQLLEVIEPLTAQEPLVDRYAEAIPASERDTYRAIVAEWYEAQARAKAAAAAESGDRRRRWQRLDAIDAIRIELRASFERGVEDRTQRLDSLIARLKLSPEQEGEVRGMIRAFNEETRGEATEAQRRELIREILMTLEPEQRREAIRSLRRDRPG